MMNKVEKEKYSYIKHFVECNCVLSIFKTHSNPPFHQFPVFSLLKGDDQRFVSHLAVCPNCNAVHKVLEVGLSKLQRKETAPMLKTKEEISSNLPDKLATILDKNECDITIYQEAEFVLEHELWGKPIVLHKERGDGDEVIGKSVTILGESLFKINNFSYSNVIDLNSAEDDDDDEENGS